MGHMAHRVMRIPYVAFEVLNRRSRRDVAGAGFSTRTKHAICGSRLGDATRGGGIPCSSLGPSGWGCKGDSVAGT